MSALAGDVLAVDEAGAWRVVLTAGGVPVRDRRRAGRGMSCDYVIYDEAHAFRPDTTPLLVADEHTRWRWRGATS